MLEKTVLSWKVHPGSTVILYILVMWRRVRIRMLDRCLKQNRNIDSLMEASKKYTAPITFTVGKQKIDDCRVMAVSAVM